MDKSLVCKSNALIEASYRLSVAEQRIMLACIAQVRRDQPITDDVTYSVSVADMGQNTHAAYSELQKASLRLKRREVWLTERPNGEGGYEETLVTNWVQSIRYKKQEGKVELRFTKDMVPYLSQLTEQFTRYALADIASMNSAYAIRLYELLAQWRGTGFREVSIDWLRESFQVGDKYPAIKDFKKRVIEPAIEQINEHSPLWVKWDQRKTGRKVTHFSFTFGEKAQAIPDAKPKQANKNKTKPEGRSKGSIYGIPRSVIEAKAKPNESPEDAALRLLDEYKRKAV